ncbi:hypothetical protein HKX48_000641 [Thoreauomyces humboldtii]|nr:hypothetical protein HKX48_000641 [Thoreauomyces humboldtii]
MLSRLVLSTVNRITNVWPTKASLKRTLHSLLVRITWPLTTSLLLLLCLIISGLATHDRRWFSFRVNGYDYDAGLFQECYTLTSDMGRGRQSETRCGRYDLDGDVFWSAGRASPFRKTAAAMMMFSMVALFGGLIGSMAVTIGRKSRPMWAAVVSWTILSILFEVLTLGFMIVAMVETRGTYQRLRTKELVRLEPRLGLASFVCMATTVLLVGILGVEGATVDKYRIIIIVDVSFISPDEGSNDTTAVPSVNEGQCSG